MDSPPSPNDPFHGLNPADLMAAAAMPTDGDADTLPLSHADLPSVTEIAAAFPDLEILDLIGHGGMSAVFKARQPRLDRIVALKVLPKALAATPGFAERFTREGRVLARLSHPGIVAVHDFGESGGFCYLIMEYVDGVNLRQAMRAGRFTPEQALGIVPVMCEALQYAHSQGVLHRDIKPENILLDAQGRVKIVDFGIAKILDENGGDEMMLTQSGARLGTAPYMAPEQIEKPASVDHRADIYSLGVVFYEMLTGELPLGRFAAPSEKAAVNGGMDEVVFRALAKERDRRQQSVGEFKTQVESAQSAPGSTNGHWSSGLQKRVLILGGAMTASVFVSANVILLRHLLQASQLDLAGTVLPVVLLNAGGFSLILNLLLWLRFVPINRIYGVQSPATLACPKRWYEVNACFGKHAFWWSSVIFGAGIAGFYQLPRHQDAYAWAAIALALVGVAASVVSTLVWIRRHPVGGPEIKPHSLVRNIELLVPALVLAFFIKAFICASYFIPNGGEPGVAKGSHWMASRLNTGFAPGDLIAYQHENGQTWLARVVAVEPKGLLLKRGGSPEEFSVPWDKVMGRMLFSYWSPPGTGGTQDKTKETTETALPLRPVSDGTSKGDQIWGPELLYVQLKLGGNEWSSQIYDPNGKLVTDAKAIEKVAKSFPDSGKMIGEDKDEVCVMQFWFVHPDFDMNSRREIELLDEEGKPVWAGFGRNGPTIISLDQPPLQSCTLHVGKRDQLPKSVDVALRYSFGQWRMGSVVPPEFTEEIMLKGAPGILTGLGSNKDGKAFVTWHNEHARQTQIDCFATLKSGQRISSTGGTLHGMWVEERVESVSFQVPLADVQSFQIRSRQIKRKEFKTVVLPPLP